MEQSGLERCGGIDMDRLIYRDMLSYIDNSILEQVKNNRIYQLRMQSQLAELAVKAKYYILGVRKLEGE